MIKSYLFFILFIYFLISDPDAPSRKEPKFREWHHWLMGNIKGSDLEGADHLSRYIGSGPPPDTGLHRYVFLLYKQPKFIVFDELRLLAKWVLSIFFTIEISVQFLY